MKDRICAALLAGALLIAGQSPAAAKPPLEAFSPEADIHDMTISQDGKRVAWVQKTEQGDAVVERNLETGDVRAITRTDGYEIIGLKYITNRHLFFLNYRIRYFAGDRDVFRGGAAWLHDLDRNKSYRFDAFGRLLTISEARDRVYFGSSYGISEVLLSTGNMWSDDLGGHDAQRWAMSPSGKVLAAQDIDRERGTSEIFAREGLKRRVLFSENGKPAEVFLMGPTPDEAAVILLDQSGDAPVLRALSLADGKLGDPILASSGETPRIITDQTGIVAGAVVAGLYPKYEFFDAALTRDANSMRASFPGQAVTIADWSANQRKLPLHVEGGVESGRYAVFDRDTRKLTSILSTRPQIARSDIGEGITIEYSAKDGRKISAVVTWPAAVAADKRRNLPMIVMPHDMPDHMDRIQFHWLAQFLANEGYLVLQPNYRGSVGFGGDFRVAGYGQYGRGMQQDIADGIEALTSMGWVDPSRVCVLGKGWGGYMALMAAGQTPDKYRCVASIGAITDLPDFMEVRALGDTRFNDYYAKWIRLLGDPDENGADQRRFSPLNLARDIVAPVLLIHSDNDNLAPDRQSKKMETVLKAYGKSVRYVVLPKDSDELLYPESRQKVLQELGAFFAANLSPRLASAN